MMLTVSTYNVQVIVRGVAIILLFEEDCFCQPGYHICVVTYYCLSGTDTVPDRTLFIFLAVHGAFSMQPPYHSSADNELVQLMACSYKINAYDLKVGPQ